MTEEELVEVFDKTDYDEKENIKLPPPAIEAAKSKRPTVAGLKKELDALKDDVEESIFGWLGELATRLDAVETGYKTITGPAYNELSHKIDNQDDAIGTIAGALKSHLEEPAATPPEPAQELEFAQPPQQRAGEQISTSDIAAAANACQHMADVLLITRALKEIPDLTDKERNEILYIAGRASGVILTPGLQIRAGVKFTGA